LKNNDTGITDKGKENEKENQLNKFQLQGVAGQWRLQSPPRFATKYQVCARLFRKNARIENLF